MSSSIAADVSSVIELRCHLVNFDRTIRDEFFSMREHWQSQSGVWRDAKYEEFGATLESAMKGVEQYLAGVEQYETHLLELADGLKRRLEA